MSPSLSRLAALCLLAFSAFALAQPTSTGMEKLASFRVTIDASGKLKSAAPLDAALGEEINRAIIGAAKDIAFEPATRHGEPVEFESKLLTTVRLEPQAAGGYRIVIVSAQLAPQALVMSPPRYPRGLDRRKIAAYVDTLLVLGADGRVDGSRSRVLASITSPGDEQYKPDFERATLESFQQWSFQPDLVGGQPVAVEVPQHTRFCVEDCSQPAAPAPGAEQFAWPRAASPEIRLARVPASLRRLTAAVEAAPLRFRIAIDASGAVGRAEPIGQVEAGLLQAARTGLLATRFFPATVDGRAVASEMPMSLPVRVEAGKPRPVLERLGYEVPVLSEPTPALSGDLGMRNGEIHVRLHVVTGADGRADMKASGVDKLEILPHSSAAAQRSLRARLEQAIAKVRVEPVLVDGRSVPLEFWREHAISFCTQAGGGCTPKQTARPAPDGAVKLPAGIELARQRP